MLMQLDEAQDNASEQSRRLTVFYGSEGGNRFEKRGESEPLSNILETTTESVRTREIFASRRSEKRSTFALSSWAWAWGHEDHFATSSTRRATLAFYRAWNARGSSLR